MFNREVVSRDAADIRGAMLRTMKGIREQIKANKKVHAIIVVPHDETRQDLKIMGMGPVHLMTAAYHILGSAALFLERDLQDGCSESDKQAMLKSLEAVRTAEAVLRARETAVTGDKPRGDA
jgi:hypothetical protein